jgi:16S rRNA (cytosine967-C5)-methyltransferase
MKRHHGRTDLQRAEYQGTRGAGRDLLQEIVLGVRRNLFLLDAILGSFLPARFDATHPRTLNVLRMGVHDLVFRERVPAAIVVSECVELCGGHKKARGFVNAVLRRVAESLTRVDWAAGVPPLDRRTVETAPLRAVLLNRDVLPDFAEQPQEHLSRRFTLTPWFAAELLKLLPLEAASAARAMCGRPVPAFRPRRGGLTLQELADALRAAGCEDVSVHAPVVAARAPGRIGELALVREGQCRVQDATAAEVAPFLLPQAGERILDLCAAPGGKSLHLAELMDGRGEIVACHRAGPSGAQLIANIAASGFASIHAHDLGADAQRLPEGVFDAALVDAPCSNSGVLAKRVDARFRLDAETVAELTAIQLRILSTAAERVRPSGRLVYSTCSILPQENEAVVRAFLERNARFRLDEEFTRYPQRTGRDGGYAARLVRTS